MVKSYLKYEHAKTLGLITSATSNVIWTIDEDAPGATSRPTGAGRAVVGANEEVFCWDVKKGELLSRWRDGTSNAQVTAIAHSTADPDIYAVGYGDGSIRVWDSRLTQVIIKFNGHRSAITRLAFDESGVRLASGAQDTDVIIWDLVAEVGLFKLRGHKNQITGLQFLRTKGNLDGTVDGDVDEGPATNGDVANEGQPSNFLLSTSKEALIKLWDLDSQHCIETHVTQTNGECWSLAVSPDHDGCVTGGNDGELKVWTVDIRALSRTLMQLEDDKERKYLHERGTLYRHGKDRTLGISFHARGKCIAAHGPEKAVELWRIRSESEVQKSLARKRRRRREKAVAKEGQVKGVADEEEEHSTEDISTTDINEILVPYVIVRTTGKVKSIDWAQNRDSKSLRILVSTTNNQLEVYNLPVKQEERKSKSEEPPDYNRTFAVDIPGHRTDVRAIGLSSDDRMLLSASNGSLKIWNVRTQSCIRTLDCGYALCSAFLPGDKIVVIGNRNGELELFDIASSTLVETVKAHEGPVWTLHVHPDGKSVVTGSADKTAKFWHFEIVQEEVPGSRRTTPRLKLVHTRTLKVSDDILSIRYSPDARLIAVALLDNTVKVFFVDSLKLFLNLYGHKLPVLNMDISYDSKLIVTCSADKNVRLWGLDFGDCHKALFAHQDSIMQVAFVPHNQDGNGHHFFSASKDKMIKYWDGDKFEQIQKLDGHHGEIWAIAVSRTGELLVSASHDKSIRVWQQTSEQIFLEEEREKELEELYESTLTTSLEQEEEPGGEKAEVVAAGKQTAETLMAGEKIAEALEVGIEDLGIVREWRALKAAQPSAAPPQRNPIFMAYNNISAEQHVLSTIQKIPAAALQDALLVLSFSRLPALFTFLGIWAQRQLNMPLTCRVLFFMLKTHHRQVIASKTMRPMLEDIRSSLRRALQMQKDQMGFNMAALRFVGRQVRDKGTREYIDEERWEEEDEREGKGRKKRAFVDVA